MKKCPMCGVEVDDHATECPECGCPIADTSGFSLKGGGPAPKKSNAHSIGTTVSTGSGLTDILNDGMEEEYSSVGGSIPISLSKNDIGDYEVKHKSHIGRTIFRILLLLAVAYGAYYLLDYFVFSNKKAYSYDDAIGNYMKAINDNDLDYMRGIMPPYLSDREASAKDILNNMSSLYINSYSIDDKVFYADKDLYELQDAIKLQTSKTARITSAYDLKVTFNVLVDGDSSKLENGANLNITMNMSFIEINNKWYLLLDSYDNIDYN
ncbi:MAG: zinc ribbon domain-containing protein [Lachnospiraceae bacterium]|nr:zinc ribbon domain-containing protein [Lachnospiraceae bacterium]